VTSANLPEEKTMSQAAFKENVVILTGLQAALDARRRGRDFVNKKQRYARVLVSGSQR
jgi:hypothetical protein